MDLNGNNNKKKFIIDIQIKVRSVLFTKDFSCFMFPVFRQKHENIVKLLVNSAKNIQYLSELFNRKYR